MKKTLVFTMLVLFLATPLIAEAGFSGGGFRGGGFRSSPSFRSTPSYRASPAKPAPAYKAAPKQNKPVTQRAKKETVKPSTPAPSVSQNNTTATNPLMWMFGWMLLTQNHADEKKKEKYGETK